MCSVKGGLMLLQKVSNHISLSRYGPKLLAIFKFQQVECSLLHHGSVNCLTKHILWINNYVMASLNMWIAEKHLPFPKQALVFTCLHLESFGNTVGKGEIARNEQFLLFPQCFLHFLRALCHCHQTSDCCLQTLSVWKSPKFVVWERVQPFLAGAWPICKTWAVLSKKVQNVCKLFAICPPYSSPDKLYPSPHQSYIL